MGQFTKVATCCYCGVRAALVLAGTTRHELVCSGCGAPLHDLKSLKVAPAKTGKPHSQAASIQKKTKSARKPVKKTRGYDTSREDDHKARRKDGFRDDRKREDDKREDYKRRKPKRKSGFKRFLSEAFDVLEDIFD